MVAVDEHCFRAALWMLSVVRGPVAKLGGRWHRRREVAANEHRVVGGPLARLGDMAIGGPRRAGAPRPISLRTRGMAGSRVPGPYQWPVPGSPLKGPLILEVIQPP